MEHRTRKNVLFETDHLNADLKGRSVRGGLITVAAQGLKLVLSLGSIVILARLLSPEDYGLIAMVTAVTGFIYRFKDMGLSMATVQRAEVNHQQVSTLFWINVLIGVVLMGLTSMIAPGISVFFNEPRLTQITIVLSIGLLISGLAVQHQALLRRQMRFAALAIIDVVAMIGSVLAGIGLSLLGYGYWSLVWMTLVTAIVTLVGVWIACRWVPGLPVRGVGVRSMLVFGGNLAGFNLVNYFARNADNILIGKYLGAEALGLYTKAYGLFTLPLQQINGPVGAVAIPALSRLQGDPERYRSYYTSALSLIALVTMPLAGFLIVMSEDIILVLLGSKWIGASAIFSVFAISALVQPIGNTGGWLFISQDRTDEMLRMGLINSLITVGAFIVGLNWGAIGVALSYTIVTIVMAPILFYFFVCRRGPVAAMDIVKAISYPLYAASLVLISLYYLRSFQIGGHSLVNLIQASGVTVFVVILGLSVLPGGRALLSRVIEMISRSVRKSS